MGSITIATTKPSPIPVTQMNLNRPIWHLVTWKDFLNLTMLWLLGIPASLSLWCDDIHCRVCQTNSCSGNVIIPVMSGHSLQSLPNQLLQQECHYPSDVRTFTKESAKPTPAARMSLSLWCEDIPMESAKPTPAVRMSLSLWCEDIHCGVCQTNSCSKNVIIPLMWGYSLRSLPNQLLQPTRACPHGLGYVKSYLCKLAFYAQSNRMVISERQIIYTSKNTKATSKCCMLYAAIISLNNSINPSQIMETDCLKKAALVAG